MAEQSSQSIHIDADPATVMAAIADFDHYPQWAASVRKAEVQVLGSDGRASRVAFTLDAGVFQDEYELAYTWTGDERVDWRLIRARMMRDQQGSYALRAEPGGGTYVTYTLSVELVIPMLGLLKRKGERIVMDTALRELKKHVESGSAA